MFDFKTVRFDEGFVLNKPDLQYFNYRNNFQNFESLCALYLEVRLPGRCGLERQGAMLLHVTPKDAPISWWNFSSEKRKLEAKLSK